MAAAKGLWEFLRSKDVCMDLLSTDQPNDFDWQRSKAHLMLLSKCRDAKAIEDFERNPMWSEALKEMPKRAIKRMLHDGMLVEADLSDVLKYKYKASELKSMLKERRAPASGRKDELIRRLVQADSENMKRATDGLSLFVCSARGREIAEQYIAEEDAKRAELEHKVLRLIDQHMFGAASVAVAAYEAEQPLARGVGIDWQNHDPAHDVAILEFIWVSIPKILSGLDEGRVTCLRVAASMNYLLGVTSLAKWLPPIFLRHIEWILLRHLECSCSTPRTSRTSRAIGGAES